MKSLQGFLLAAGVLFVGACADDASAPVAVDSGASSAVARDAGVAEVGKTMDGGALAMDAALTVEAGAAAVDASVTVDAGSAPVRDASTVDAGPPDAGTIEVAGRWRSNFGTDEDIDNASWSFTKLVEFDNEKNVAITQNAADDMFGPSKFNRYVWTPISSVDGSFFYCTVDFGLSSAADARASTKTADASDPLNAGCGGFGWTKLSPAAADAGM